MPSQITSRQAAEALGVSVARVHVLIREGRLPATKFGVQYLIQSADLAKVKDRKPGRPSATPKPAPKRKRK